MRRIVSLAQSFLVQTPNVEGLPVGIPAQDAGPLATVGVMLTVSQYR